MKHWLKKINRGLVLTAVLVVGLIIYIVSDIHNFKSEKPQVEQTINEFVQVLSEQNITPEEYREKGKKYSGEDSKKRIDNFSEFIDKYWVAADSEGYNDWAVYKSDIKGAMKELTEDVNSGYVTEFSAEVRNCKISKDGPNAALAECTVKLVFTGSQDCAIIGTDGIDRDYVWNETEPTDQLVKVSIEQYCTFGLERTSEGWKIANNECYSAYASSVIVDSEISE